MDINTKKSKVAVYKKGFWWMFDNFDDYKGMDIHCKPLVRMMEQMLSDDCHAHC